MLITQLDIPTHEAVYRLDDAKTGLTAFIAIHSTKRGPAAGGLRMRTYPNADAALKDVLLLSEGTTFKNADAGLTLGGAKPSSSVTTRSTRHPKCLRQWAGLYNRCLAPIGLPKIWE